MPPSLESVAESIRQGRMEDAQRDLASFRENSENRAEVLFLRGYLEESHHHQSEAARLYQEVLEHDPHHTESAFRLALLADRAGDDESAIELLEKCVADQPAHVNALINLALLYEERLRLDEADECLQRVLAVDPGHHRANQFLKSVESCYDMVFDEVTQRERDQHSAVLDTPITDFELSVRSRNCLRQMNIRTLGDLLRCSEAELLSYKNFGETSLNEIKALLNQRNLSLGQGEPEPQPVEPPPPEKPMRSVSLTPNPDGTQNLNRPVSELELSVRSRKCLQWLGVSTLGELAQRSEAELMAIKNFGQTSLLELKRQLALFGLSLR